MKNAFPTIAGVILLAGLLLVVLVTAVTGTGYIANRGWFILMIAAGVAVVFVVRLLWRSWVARAADRRDRTADHP